MMYRALGFTATYATVHGAPVVVAPFTVQVVSEETTLPSRARAVTSLPVLASLFGLTTCGRRPNPRSDLNRFRSARSRIEETRRCRFR